MFDIDITTLVIAGLFTAAFIAPLYWNYRKMSQKEKKAEQLIQSLKASKGLFLSEKDYWNNQYFIGIDPVKKVLVYSENIHIHEPMIVDLNQMKGIKMEEKSHEFNKRKIVDELTLMVHPLQKAPIPLEFYDADKFSSLDAEPVLIKKWESLIRPLLKKIPEKELSA
ncbi:hypothetical protein [Cecembia rubra]|uniref:Uncharacterized protein n=1 Tax=Cecembia rubra TaxID=1485585 RepID=A0A2P8DQ08_9BACT|nr:hypothetical protein [Cecembia rubra]PSK99272.1 hypothetical protein CLV48_11758 [Cecembia rubra]